MAQVPGELVPGRQQPRDIELPRSSPTPIGPRIGGQIAPQASEGITLVLTEIDLVGNVTLTTEQLQDAWTKHIGQEISVATLYTIANEVTQKYAEQGYALSFAFLPEQEIDSSGIVTIRVVEGYIEQAVFVGDMGSEDKPVTERIQEMTRNIVKSKPLKSQDLERYLLLMNDFPGYKVETTFSASRTTQDASNLIVKVTRKRFEATLSADNQLSGSLGTYRLGGSASIHGLLTDADTLTLSKNCGMWCNVYNNNSLAYSTYIGTEGWRAGMRYDRTLIKPMSGLLSVIDFTGDNENIAFDVSYPIIRGRQENLNVGSSFSMSDNQTETFFGTLTRDKLRVLNVYGSYDYADDKGAVNLIRAEIAQGLDIMSATDDDDPLRSKALGSATFTNLTVSGTRDQPLGFISPALAPYSVFLSARGQVAAGDALLSSAQCFYGGSEFGRGYDSGAVGGDHCLMASAEIRRGFFYKQLYTQAYAFMDAGAVWLKGDPGGDTSLGAQSYGIGTRLLLGRSAQADLQLAFPVRESFTSNDKDTPRALFSLKWIY
jgi:hemolysin activation/secretion protein